MDVDIRYLPNQDPGEILAQIREIADLEIVKCFTRAPAIVSRKNPYVLALRDAVGALDRGRGAERRPRRRVGRGLVPRGRRPAVEFGPVGGGHHGPDEWVSVSSLERYRQALGDFVRGLPARLERQRGPAAAGRRGRPGVSRGRWRTAHRAWARSLLLRAVLGATAIVVLTAAATATAGLLQVKSLVDTIKHEAPAGIKTPRDRRRAGGQAADDPHARLRPALRRRSSARSPVRSDTMMLVRLDPNKAATAVMSIPRDLKVEIPGHGIGQDQRAPTRSAAAAWRVKTIKNLLGTSRSTTSST